MSFLDKILGPIFGTKPSVPEIQQLELSDEQIKAIQANIAAAPEAARLADMTADQIEDLIRRTTPNFDTLTRGISSSIEDFTKGRIPKDVSETVMRSDAAKALAGGYGGTGMHSALVARDLGLTSLDLVMKGIGAAESWLNASQALYAPAMATYQNMFITPSQQAAFDVEERNTQFQRSWLKSQIKAMPDPVMRGIHDTIMSLAVAYLGGNYQGQNAQQNYAQAGAGVGTGGYNGGWGGGWTGQPGYGTPGYGPGGGNVPPPAYGGYDWESIGGVGGAESPPAGDFGAGFGAGFGGYV